VSGRVCVVLCAQWPIVAACIDPETVEGVWEEPLMIVHSGRVTSCSPEARAEGVRIGQRLRDAYSICPAVRRVPWSPERDQRMFDRLLATLADVVPVAGVMEPGVVYLGAEGVTRYYGSEDSAVYAITHALKSLGEAMRVSVGYADTLFAAHQAAVLAAHHPTGFISVGAGGNRDFLDPLPITALADDDVAELCVQLGVTTLGQFAALERDQVTERFGHRGTLLHQLASGEDPRHHSKKNIPPLSDVVWRSDDPVCSGEQLSFAISSSATTFVSQLLDQGCVVQTVNITLVDDRGQHHTKRWSHPRYFTAPDLVHRVRWQGESLHKNTAHDDYQRGIVEVCFVAQHPDRAAGYEDSLWGNAHRDTALHHAVSSLQATLGHQNVTRVTTHPGHDFAESQQVVAWGDKPPPRDVDQVETWAGQLPAPQPATVFTPPLPVAVIDEAGQPVHTTAVGAGLTAPPHTLVSDNRRRRVTAWAGPWPVMERWWERKPVVHRIQLLDDTGIGWLVKTVADGNSDGEWLVEARYD
jgi:protein ImuB